ncbi:CDP-glycerol glycerophosphotransferase family protein [Listeria ilorinensis]|uniref:CDP-glycerol glycerophosphotransferase family protein n=1 Tax=Listeria ilorinensis TaxID=2867439 RepID=UPI001EF61684|nr:CDP-glycerol glycerophosphotransferase family protein [Listeria ilorinensis]
MKFVILGYNIFSSGGTTQSNINLMHELLIEGHEVIYGNFISFSLMDLLSFQYKYTHLKNIKMKSVESLLHEPSDADYIYITKETFFPFANIFRSSNPNVKIVGEIHAPLELIENDIETYLPYFSYIRVATESIKKEFMAKYKFRRVFVQKVSLDHIEQSTKHLNQYTKNFLILSRFDETSKDISYAIRLMEYIVNFLKRKEIHLYINGYGEGELLYKNLIHAYSLQANVFINQTMPADYIYLSTSRYETFGYSIMEALMSGHKVALYHGDDRVIEENFQPFHYIEWLSKDVPTDAKRLIDLINKKIEIKYYQEAVKIFGKWKRDYIKNILENTKKDVYFSSKLTKEISDSRVKRLMKEVYDETSDITRNSWYYKCYLILKGTPLVRRIIQKKGIVKFLKYLEGQLLTKGRREKRSQSIHTNFVFVESFHGKNFTGDPKYLALAVKEIDPTMTVFVSSINQLVDMEVRYFGLIPIRTGSKKYQEMLERCKYIILNGNSLDKVTKRKRQIYVQTWHGLPLKKMVCDLENKKQQAAEAAAFIPRMKKWDYLLTSSHLNTKLFTSAFSLKDNRYLQIIEEGAPRNAYLLKNRYSMNEKERIHWKYFNRPYNTCSKFILFCPTWRKNNRKSVFDIDLLEVIRMLPANYEIIVKLHPNEGHLRRKYNTLHKRIHCFFNELTDIQELYVICDALITDYSSAIFDFAHVEKKLILLQEDASEYTQEIGWYFDLKEKIGMVGNKYTEKELVDEILRPSVTSYCQEVTSELMIKDSIETTEKVLNRIMTERR